MKVVMLSKYPLEGLRGGPAMHRAKLISYISQMGEIELHIVTFGGANEEVKANDLNFHVIKKVDTFNIPFFIPIALRTIKRIINGIKPDIVHALGTFYPWATLATFVRNEYPVVMTQYGIVTEELKYTPNSFSFSTLFSILHEKYVINKVTNIIVPASSLNDFINKTTSNIYVIPHGIEFEKIQKIQSHNIEKHDIFLIAELRKIKGIDILIKVIPVVIESIPDLSVYLAGYGYQKNELENLVKKLKLEKHVKFLGFISEKNKYQYYKSSKIIVIPSRWDVLPITLYEAMASGKPVVASNVGGIPDAIDDGKTGFLFESENEVDLAEKIVKLLKDKKLRDEMGKSAKEKAKQFEWSKIAEKTVEVYKEVITDFHERKTKNKQKRKIL